jgi:hypothetical protein
MEGRLGGAEPVLRSARLEVLGWSRAVPITLQWCPWEPYEVSLWFPGEQRDGAAEGVQWRMARELLADGLLGPSGLGDVSVLPSLDLPAHVELVLSSPDGVIGLCAPTRLLWSFLVATWQHVPAGAEAHPEVGDYFIPGGPTDRS